MKALAHLMVATAFVAAALTFPLSAATRYVSLDSPNPTPPYATWETAATNIQDAVDAAKAGDTVLVNNGVYAVGGRDVGAGPSRVNVTISIRLESVNGPMVTTIDGGWDGERWSGTGVRCVYLGSNVVLSGFTLRNGASEVAGGVFSEPSGVVTNCILTGNSGVCGGGGASGGTLYSCVLTGNSSYGNNMTCLGGGGGAGLCTLYNCTLTGNSAQRGGGAAGSTLYNCVLTGNSVGGNGGGVYGCTLYRCVLVGNGASPGFMTPGGGGGACSSTLSRLRRMIARMSVRELTNGERARETVS